MTDWQAVDTIPRRQKLRVQTASGLERIAYVRDYATPRLSNNRMTIHGFGKTPKGWTGDLAIVGWMPL